MQASDAKRFRDLLRGMGRMYGSEPDAVVLDAYWLALGDWSLAEFEQACGHLMKTAKFMPRPADFSELRKAERPTAGEAWAQVRALVRSGAESSGDPVIDATVRVLGGYRALGMTNSDQMHFLERRFAEHYETIGDREDVREALPALTGGPRLEALYNDPKRLA